MAHPTSDTAIQRPDLGQLVYEFRETAPAMGFIGLQVMPLFPVTEQSSTYPVIPKEVLLKVEETKRAMRGRYPRSDWEFEEGFYSTSENGWEEVVDDRERKLYASKFDAEAIATQRASNVILRGQEKRIADMVFNASNFTPHALTNEWDDKVNATPIDDIKAGKMAIREACGMLPNVLIIAYSTFENLKRCDQLVDMLQYTFPMIDMENMTTAQMAHLFNVEQVLVGGSVYDAGKKGQNADITDLWSDEYAMLTRISSGMDITSPCIGRTFLWTPDSDSNTVVESYRDEGVRGDVIRVRHDTGEQFIASKQDDGTVVSNISQACSYLFSNVTT